MDDPPATPEDGPGPPDGRGASNIDIERVFLAKQGSGLQIWNPGVGGVFGKTVTTSLYFPVSEFFSAIA